MEAELNPSGRLFLRALLLVILLSSPLVVLAQPSTSTDSTGTVGADRWLAQDKIHHFAASGFLTGLGYYLVSESANVSGDQAAGLAIGFSLAFGVAKELRDTRHGTPSWKDLAADVAGALVVAALVRKM